MAHDLVTELLQYSSLACFMPILQLCANLLIPNCLRSNLSYSPLAALELYVNKNIAVIVLLVTAIGMRYCHVPIAHRLKAWLSLSGQRGTDFLHRPII